MFSDMTSFERHFFETFCPNRPNKTFENIAAWHFPWTTITWQHEEKRCQRTVSHPLLFDFWFICKGPVVWTCHYLHTTTTWQLYFHKETWRGRQTNCNWKQEFIIRCENEHKPFNSFWRLQMLLKFVLQIRVYILLQVLKWVVFFFVVSVPIHWHHAYTTASACLRGMERVPTREFS